jgi:NAD(P)-dependent dehydrogenase (short-subunit alcohol dehydrogenase family)
MRIGTDGVVLTLKRPVWSPLQEAAMDKETLSEWHKNPAPMGRIGQPSELSPAYVLLASQDGSFISGQSIHVNGGAIVAS